MKFIETENVKFHYDISEEERNMGVFPKDVIDDVSLGISKGEFVALLGHNGSGKSTIAKHFNAMLLPTFGEVYINGMNTKDEENTLPIRKTVGLVLQNPDNQLVA
ncbi:MAG: ATP-binding cassette domain-containing protein, partial [Acutalibacteraceae bacterium]